MSLALNPTRDSRHSLTKRNCYDGCQFRGGRSTIGGGRGKFPALLLAVASYSAGTTYRKRCVDWNTEVAVKTETIGTRELSAWQVAPGVTWIQSRSPQFARKLSQRSDSQQVACGVAGGYLRTFEFPHGLAWAKRLIGRYTTTVTPTNAGVFVPALAVACRNSKTVKSHAPLGQGNRQPKTPRRNEHRVRSGIRQASIRNEPRTNCVYQESIGAGLFPPTGEESYG